MNRDKIDLPIPAGAGVRARINMINSILDDLISHELNREQVVRAICDLIIVEIKLFNEINKQ